MDPIGAIAVCHKEGDCSTILQQQVRHDGFPSLVVSRLQGRGMDLVTSKLALLPSARPPCWTLVDHVYFRAPVIGHGSASPTELPRQLLPPPSEKRYDLGLVKQGLEVEGYAVVKATVSNEWVDAAVIVARKRLDAMFEGLRRTGDVCSLGLCCQEGARTLGAVVGGIR